MELQGSCHCGAVSFSLESRHPYPFCRCYCSICRKTAGGGGYAINLGGDHATLRVSGGNAIHVYQARIDDPKTGATQISPAKRHFCKHCGSALWAWDPRWPELVHPFASAIDTPLPRPPQLSHIMVQGIPKWISIDAGTDDRLFPAYPDESLANWHQRQGLEL